MQTKQAQNIISTGLRALLSARKAGATWAVAALVAVGAGLAAAVFDQETTGSGMPEYSETAHTAPSSPADEKK